MKPDLYVSCPEGTRLSILKTWDLASPLLTVYYRYLPSIGKGGGFAAKEQKHKKSMKKPEESEEEEINLLD